MVLSKCFPFIKCFSSLVVFGLGDEIGQLRSELNGLKQLIEDTMYGKAEITFTFEVNAILDFFKSSNERYSRQFYAQMVRSSVTIKLMIN